MQPFRAVSDANSGNRWPQFAPYSCGGGSSVHGSGLTTAHVGYQQQQPKPMTSTSWQVQQNTKFGLPVIGCDLNPLAPAFQPGNGFRGPTQQHLSMQQHQQQLFNEQMTSIQRQQQRFNEKMTHIQRQQQIYNDNQFHKLQQRQQTLPGNNTAKSSCLPQKQPVLGQNQHRMVFSNAWSGGSNASSDVTDGGDSHSGRDDDDANALFEHKAVDSNSDHDDSDCGDDVSYTTANSDSDTSDGNNSEANGLRQKTLVCENPNATESKLKGDTGYSKPTVDSTQITNVRLEGLLAPATSDQREKPLGDSLEVSNASASARPVVSTGSTPQISTDVRSNQNVSQPESRSTLDTSGKVLLQSSSFNVKFNQLRTFREKIQQLTENLDLSKRSDLSFAVKPEDSLLPPPPGFPSAKAALNPMSMNSVANNMHAVGKQSVPRDVRAWSQQNAQTEQRQEMSRKQSNGGTAIHISSSTGVNTDLSYGEVTQIEVQCSLLRQMYGQEVLHVQRLQQQLKKSDDDRQEACLRLEELRLQVWQLKDKEMVLEREQQQVLQKGRMLSEDAQATVTALKEELERERERARFSEEQLAKEREKATMIEGQLSSERDRAIHAEVQILAEQKHNFKMVLEPMARQFTSLEQHFNQEAHKLQECAVKSKDLRESFNEPIKYCRYVVHVYTEKLRHILTQLDDQKEMVLAGTRLADLSPIDFAMPELPRPPPMVMAAMQSNPLCRPKWSQNQQLAYDGGDEGSDQQMDVVRSAKPTPLKPINTVPGVPGMYRSPVAPSAAASSDFQETSFTATDVSSFDITEASSLNNETNASRSAKESSAVRVTGGASAGEPSSVPKTRPTSGKQKPGKMTSDTSTTSSTVSSATAAAASSTTGEVKRTTPVKKAGSPGSGKNNGSRKSSATDEDDKKAPAGPAAQGAASGGSMSSYNRLMATLRVTFPDCEVDTFKRVVKELRQAHNGSLSGRSFQSLVRNATQMLVARGFKPRPAPPAGTPEDDSQLAKSTLDELDDFSSAPK